MKKLFLVLVVSLLITNFLSAQNAESDTRNGIGIGLKAGINVSNVYNTQGDNFIADNQVGFAGGVFISIPIGTYLGIQPEVLYSQKGFKGSGNVLGASYNFNRRTDFIDVPIYLSIKPIANLTIQIGPQFSYQVRQVDDFGNASVIQQTEFSNQNIRKNIFGISGGVDINVYQVVIGLRASYDLQRNNGDNNSTTPQYRNAWYQATIAYKFM